MSGDYILSTCLDQFCLDVVDSSWLPFLQWLYCSLHFFEKGGVVILCVCLGTVQYRWISIGLVIVQLSAVFCPSVQYLSFVCEAFSSTILDNSSFSMFHSGQVFHVLVCCLTVVLPKIFFTLPTPFPCPVFFSLFHAPVDVVVHFLVFLRSFRFKSFLSQFSPFVTQIKNLCSLTGFCLLTMIAKDLTGCFNQCRVDGGDHWIQVCVFIVHDGERCKLPTCNSWKVSNTLGSFSFLRSNLSLVCFGLLISFRQRRKIIISKSWSLPASAPDFVGMGW